ncbi:hypothetical protein PLESTF_000729300 [Pleodorina starrii]|nr:hypothetical protein PLESTF_000729300 [Pleodorina starrii]
MAKRSCTLGCSGAHVLLDVLRQQIQELLVVRDDTMPERTCVQVGSECTPLCQADVLAAVAHVHLGALYERLATLVELRGRSRSRLSPNTHWLVRELLTDSSAALNACTALMRLLDDTGFREGSRELDRETRDEVDVLSSLLDRTVAKYGATPLLLMAVLVEGGLSGIVAAMLQGRDIGELSRRGSLFHQVLLLIRNASRLPDVAMLLASPTRHHGHQLSVLGLLAALATSARVVLSWEQPGGGRAAAAQRTDSAATAEVTERQRKMALKAVETHGLLQAAVEAANSRAGAGAGAALAENRPARIGQELRGEQGRGTAAAASGMSTGHHQPTGSVSRSGLGGGSIGYGGGGSRHTSLASHEGRYAQQHQHWTSATGDQYGFDGGGGGGAYGRAPASAASAYTLYQNDGSSGGPPLGEDLHGILTSGPGNAGGGAAAASGATLPAAAQYGLDSLSFQRELQQALLAVGGGDAGGPYVSSQYDPMVASPTLSYPWRTQQATESAAAAMLAAQEPLYPQQQQQLTQQQQQQAQQQQAYTLYEAAPLVDAHSDMAPADGGASQLLRSHHHNHHQQQQQLQQQRGYSVPSTPQRPSMTTAATAAQLAQPVAQQLLHQQALLQQEREQQQQLQAILERLQQLPIGGAAPAAAPSAAAPYPSDRQAFGRHLGGYSVGDTAGVPPAATYPVGGDGAGPLLGDMGAQSAAAASRARSTARQRMPSADSASSGSLGLGGGGFGGGGTIFADGASWTGRQQQAWADASPWQQQQGAQPSQQQTRQQQQSLLQQAPVRAVSSVGGPPIRDPWQYDEAAAGAVSSRSAAAAQPGSLSPRVRPLVTEGTAPAAAHPAWSPSGGGGGGGRVATAWSAVPAEAAWAQQRQQQQVVVSRTAAPAVAPSGGSRPASRSRGATHGSSRSHTRGASTHSPGAGDSSSSSGGSSSGVERRSSRGGWTLRALAADSGLIPGLSRSPREHLQQQEQEHHRHVHHSQRHHQQDPPSRRQPSAPRMAAQQAPAPAPPAAPTGSLLDRHRAVERRSAAGDPRVGAAPAAFGGTAAEAGGGDAWTAEASTSLQLLQRYGIAHQPAPSPRAAAPPSSTGPLAAATTAGGVGTAGCEAPYYTSSTAPYAPAAAPGSRSPKCASAVASGTSPDRPGSGSSGPTAARPAIDAATAPATAAAAGTAPIAASGAGGVTPVSPSGSSLRHQRSGLEAATAEAVAARQWDLLRGISGGGGGGDSSSGGGGAGGQPPAQRYSSPYRGVVDGRCAAAAAQAAYQPAPQPAARSPSSSSAVPSGVRPAGGGGGGSSAATARPMDANGGGSAAAEAHGRRRMAAARRYDSSSDGGEYDGDLQYALRMSRLEAEAAEAEAEAMRLSTAAAAAAAAANAAAGAGAGAGAGPPSSPPAGARATHGSPSGTGGDRRAPAPAPARVAPSLLPSGAIDEGGGGGTLVGAPVPMAALHQRYAVLNPLLSAKLVSLEDDFPRTRRVAGDGNCFYRAALFALLEHVMAAPDEGLCEQLETVVQSFLRRLEAMQQLLEATPAAAAAAAAGARSRAATPERARGGSGGGGGGAPGSPGGAGAGGDPAAVRGGKRLLRLLRTAWFKAADAPEPSDVSSLERLFNHSAHSGEVIRFARRLTAAELQSDEAFYGPFIPGCGGDYGGMSLAQICGKHVLPMGVEVEQLQDYTMCSRSAIRPDPTRPDPTRRPGGGVGPRLPADHRPVSGAGGDSGGSGCGGQPGGRH